MAALWFCMGTKRDTCNGCHYLSSQNNSLFLSLLHHSLGWRPVSASYGSNLWIHIGTVTAVITALGTKRWLGLFIYILLHLAAPHLIQNELINPLKVVRQVTKDCLNEQWAKQVKDVWKDQLDVLRNHKHQHDRFHKMLRTAVHRSKWLHVVWRHQFGYFALFCLCILQLQNGYVKYAQWRDVMTFSWML